jgi:predicted transcriptional regulator
MSSDTPDNEREKRLAELKAAIDAGLAEIDAGLCGPIDFDELIAEVMDELRDVELKAKIDAALTEADAGLIAPLDIEAIKAELRAELDQHGKPRATTDH